ncbi:hypothetical protein F2Q69_00059413 [Brassica cretica]|uniref:CCHC-type domain-containing protein n=1 Tax=Brassica cretica TaxID=69181 RepID=A0A8S9RKX5_BRACR|nr:hypothetical protein F2Q69_00059413 [Brassica cretica]
MHDDAARTNGERQSSMIDNDLTTRVTHSRFHLGSEEHKAVGVDLLPFANIVYSNLEVTDDSAIAQGNNHCYEHEHESTGRNPTDSHMGYEQEERYEDLRERNQAPDMYGSRRNYATTHNPRRNESEFMHRERTTEPRCRQEQRTAGRLDPLIVLVQGLLDRLDHRTGESSEQRPSSSPDYLKMVTDDFAMAQGNNHYYEHEHESTGRKPMDSHMDYEQEERYEDLRERNQAPDIMFQRRTRSDPPMMTPPRYGQCNSENRRVYSNLEVTDDSAIVQGNNHYYEQEHESTGRNPTDSHMGYEQEERYEDFMEMNQAPDMYGSRRNYATTHNPRRNESEFMHRERTPEPRCRQKQRTAGSLDPFIGRKAPDYITCFSCGEKGHYANSYPHKRQVTLPEPPTRLAIEPAPRRQAVAKQVNALELGNPEPQQPHQGLITGTCPAVPEATRKLNCCSHQILQVWSVQSTKKNTPHRSTTTLVRRSILVNHCREMYMDTPFVFITKISEDFWKEPREMSTATLSSRTC